MKTLKELEAIRDDIINMLITAIGTPRGGLWKDSYKDEECFADLDYSRSHPYGIDAIKVICKADCTVDVCVYTSRSERPTSRFERSAILICSRQWTNLTSLYGDEIDEVVDAIKTGNAGKASKYEDTSKYFESVAFDSYS